MDKMVKAHRKLKAIEKRKREIQKKGLGKVLQEQRAKEEKAARKKRIEDRKIFSKYNQEYI